MSANLHLLATDAATPDGDAEHFITKLSDKRLRPEVIARTVWVIDSSGVVDLLVPPRAKGARGRKGNLRENVRLFLIGLSLCTRLGYETTVKGVHEVLTEAVDREAQWALGVLRPRVTKSTARHPKGAVPGILAPALVENGKQRKRVFPNGAEEVSYDDLHNATRHLRQRWDYGIGSAPNLEADERARRAETIGDVVEALIVATTVPRVSGASWAIDATGQWAWDRGGARAKRSLEQAARDRTKEQIDDLVVEGIEVDEDGNTAPQQQAVPAALRVAFSDGAWGYKTGKDGRKEVGYGLHQHTIVRVPDFDAPPRSEPLLVDGFVLTPANADVVDASLDLIDRIRARHPFKLLLGDLLYSNLRADRWAYPLAQRGIEQALRLRSDQHKTVDIQGAQMQHAWLHCPTAPMQQRPLPEDNADPARWEEIHTASKAFKDHWAFDRKQPGLGTDRETKWVCPAQAGRVGCYARPATVDVAIRNQLPLITPPDDWRDRPCCIQKSIDFTPDLVDPNHQRKIAQREYVGTRRWKKKTNRRTLVEGTFGILKNPSRQRLRRGQNRLPGLAMATLVAAVKVAVFNEEQLRMWHAETGLGPADHPLLQPDQPDWGFRNLTREEAEAIDQVHLMQPAEAVTITGEVGASAA
ncbi:hypothetical protein [Cellulomonas carbonis]|uniref:Transposase n=1 Tax=Cellulomonas carbonis T26 TaxID=947969 RepID=A0A0A0BUQ0_9CELL|nr:hypothetical protein [Cellulomonas carbonis]KGM11690.1 hypothetical protein N868_07780 [Cellulomonas carbonis T26]GGB98954.1 hypothetical protein GCM10010972_09720 [Cellulomonas carbonis]